jgi:hypothetical protein
MLQFVRLPSVIFYEPLGFEFVWSGVSVSLVQASESLNKGFTQG